MYTSSGRRLTGIGSGRFCWNIRYVDHEHPSCPSRNRTVHRFAYHLFSVSHLFTRCA